MKNLISIIIPVYNAEKYISSCIDSILNQTIDNFEIILINDGSTDNSLSILNDYKNKDIRVVVIDKVNEGVSIARNVGIKHSKGKYITFIDSDDFLEPNALETMLNLMIQFNSDIVRTNYNRIDTHATYIAKTYKNNELLVLNRNNRKILYDDIINQKIGCYLWLLLIKKDLLIKNNITFNELLFVHQDIDYYINLVKHAKSIYFSDAITYNYYNNLGGSKNYKYFDRNVKAFIDLYKSIISKLGSSYKGISSSLFISLLLPALHYLYLGDKDKAKIKYNEIINNKDIQNIFKEYNKKYFSKKILIIYPGYISIKKKYSFATFKLLFINSYSLYIKVRNIRDKLKDLKDRKKRHN